MIRQQQNGEPASERRNYGEYPRLSSVRGTEAYRRGADVVDGGRNGKENALNTGDLPGQESIIGNPAGVRVTIVAQASRGKIMTRTTGATEQSRVMTGGVKGDRKANTEIHQQSEGNSPRVPVTDKQGEKDLWQSCKAERDVWSMRMLEALKGGVQRWQYLDTLGYLT